MRKVFNVFGRIIALERQGPETGWSAWLVGADGKRQPMELAVPAEVGPEELAQYLYDIYHESAAAARGDIFELPR